MCFWESKIFVESVNVISSISRRWHLTFLRKFQCLCGYRIFFALCWCLVCFQLIDNVPILQIDMVWCYFMLRDIRWLSVAGARLEKAREGIERAHGKDSSRVTLLQAGRHPELAMWVFICMLLICTFFGRKILEHAVWS